MLVLEKKDNGYYVCQDSNGDIKFCQINNLI